MAEVKDHGAEAMGFDQGKTAHHFFLRKDGGVVAVQANDPKDAVSISRIQHHLALQASELFPRRLRCAGACARPGATRRPEHAETERRD
jgi:hypothetical protein